MKIRTIKEETYIANSEGEFTKGVWVDAMVSRLSKRPAGMLLADISNGGGGRWGMARDKEEEPVACPSWIKIHDGGV